MTKLFVEIPYDKKVKKRQKNFMIFPWGGKIEGPRMVTHEN